MENFEETARQLHVTALDCITTQNFMYFMLSTTIPYNAVFTRLKQWESGYKCLPLEDWVKAKDMCDKLINFYNVTELFCGTKYPTVCDIRLAIEEWIQSGTEHIKMMAVKMKENFLEVLGGNSWDNGCRNCFGSKI